MRRHYKKAAPLIALSILLISACSALGPSSPAGSAKEWFVAVTEMDGLKVDELTCSAKRDEVRSNLGMGSAFMGLGALLLGGNVEVKIDISDIEFTTIQQNSNQAVVTVRGEMRGAIGGMVDSKHVDETVIMVLEDGAWKYCGESGR